MTDKKLYAYTNSRIGAKNAQIRLKRKGIKTYIKPEFGGYSVFGMGSANAGRKPTKRVIKRKVRRRTSSPFGFGSAIPRFRI